ncbi:MAG: glycosyltransferase [Treponemataceae bacterium]
MILTFFSVIALGISLYFLLLALLNIFWIKRHTKKPLFQGGPTVSVLIPARNEQENIERCIRSLMNQSYENYEVIVLDDNSEDKTYDIVKKIQQEFPRHLKLAQGVPLEADWKGKPFAMFQLTKIAAGDILICTDADTVHSYDSVSWAVTNILSNNADMVSGYVRQDLRSFGEKLTVPLIFILTGFALPIFLSRRIKSYALAAAIGQFIVLRADSLKKIGGYESVKNQTSDDIYLARMMRKFAFKTFFLDAKKVVACRMYSSYKESLNGVSKNIADFFGNNIFLVSLVILGVLFFLLLPLPFGIFFAYNGYTQGNYLLLASLFYMLTWLVICISRRIQWYIPFLYPILFLNLIFIAIISAFRQHSKRGFMWKGRVVK